MQIKLDYKRKFIYKFCFLLNYEVFMATRPTKCGVLTGLVTEYDLQLAEKIELKHQNEQIIAQISDALKSIKQFPIDNIIENLKLIIILNHRMKKMKTIRRSYCTNG